MGRCTRSQISFFGSKENSCRQDHEAETKYPGYRVGYVLFPEGPHVRRKVKRAALGRECNTYCIRRSFSDPMSLVCRGIVFSFFFASIFSLVVCLTSLKV